MKEIFFIDPPWGGLNYRDETLIDLKLSNMDISEVVQMCLLRLKCRSVILKHPLNANLNTIMQVIERCGKEVKVLHWSMSKTVKCLVICVKEMVVESRMSSSSSTSSGGSLKVEDLNKKEKKKKKKKKKKKEEGT